MNPSETSFTDRNVPVLTMHGEVDLASAPDLRRRLTALTDAGHQLIIMVLSNVTFFDSTGLRLLDESLGDAQRHGGTIALIGVQARVMRLMEITGLVDRFPRYDSIADAIGAHDENP